MLLGFLYRKGRRKDQNETPGEIDATTKISDLQLTFSCRTCRNKVSYLNNITIICKTKKLVADLRSGHEHSSKMTITLQFRL